MKTMSFLLSFILTFFGTFSGNIVSLFTSKADVDTVVSEKQTLSVEKNETNLQDTVEYAYMLKNSVQGVFTDAGRNGFRMSNTQMSLTHNLKGNRSATLRNAEGKKYIEDSFKTFYTDKNGLRHYFESGSENGRVNVIRLGEYYYDCHIREFRNGIFAVDKNYHVYGDRLYAQYSLFADRETDKFETFGTEISIPVRNVSEWKIDREKGYAAFVIKNAGVVGFIIPADGTTDEFYVDTFGGKYILTQTADCGDGTLKAYDADWNGKENPPYITFGARIYTDTTSSFEGIERAAYEERNPLTDITVGENNADCKYVGYDALRGVYTFTCTGTDFNVYYRDPGFQYRMPVKINGDAIDRNINIRFYGAVGCLEAAAVLDDENVLAPIDVEVCKNFCGDGGEDFYSPKDFQYGDSFVPLVVKAESQNKFTMLNLYNGWGKNQLKQISSIEFHVSYYHLSTGTTESNCIAPYSVSNTVNDGWLLPDFRTRSGNVWTGQPQYNSVGILKFVVDNGKYGEFAGSDITSCGQTYADVTDSYSAANGKYTYTLRHTEHPSNDENRTYYNINITFNEKTTFSNFKKNFSLFSFNGRANAFNSMGYLNTQNRPETVSAVTGGRTKYYTLGTDRPYYSFFDVTDETEEQLARSFGCNFGFIVLDSKVVRDGKTESIPFAVRLNGTKKSTTGDITFDAKRLVFNKGDTISMNVILLPNGVGNEEEDIHTLAVREEQTVKASSDAYTTGGNESLATVQAKDNCARFSVSGGKNMTAVRVDGITSCRNIKIYRLTDGAYTLLDNSLHGYDGYSITTGSDGKYGVSFVYNSEGKTEQFIVTAGESGVRV